MRVLVLVCGVAAGCRFGFDAQSPSHDGAPDGDPIVVGHDEDRDGIDDGLDVCPHIADPGQLDTDGDRVGDACDPNPTSPIDHLVFFDGFVAQRSEWSLTGPAPTFDGEHLSSDTSGDQQLVLSLPATMSGTDRIAVAGRIVGSSAGQQLVALGFGRVPLFPPMGTSTAAYYCEVCGGGPCGASPFFAFTFTNDNVMFTHLDLKPVPTLAPGSVAFTIDRTPTTLACDTSWPAVTQVGGALPPAIDAVAIALTMKNVVVSLDYVVQIHSD